MKRFSERYGYVEPKTAIEIGWISGELRTRIWNALIKFFEKHEGFWVDVKNILVEEILVEPIDSYGLSTDIQARDFVRSKFFELNWNFIYDLLELIDENYDAIFPVYHRHIPVDVFRHKINDALTSHKSGYRLVKGYIVEITDEGELTAIAEAVDALEEEGLFGARAHLIKALEFLSDKENPDYRNSIKESISAIESIARKISKEGKSGLRVPLNELASNTDIHRALKEGFIKLYGYTSDEDGIRHAIIGDPNVGFTEAKFMLIACSAFAHYLIEKANEAGIPLISEREE